MFYNLMEDRMNYAKHITKSAIIMIIVSLIGKLLGFAREVLIASRYGAGMETDAYFVALTGTLLVAELIRTSLSTTLIPIFAEIEYNKGKQGKIDHVNNFIHIISFIVIMLLLLCWLYTPLYVKILANGFKGEKFDLTVRLLRIGMPTMLSVCLVGVLTGFLNSEQKFLSATAVGVSSNSVFILYLLLISYFFGIKGLMITSVIASFTQVFIQFPSLYKLGWRYKLKFNFRDEYLIKIIKLVFQYL